MRARDAAGEHFRSPAMQQALRSIRAATSASGGVVICGERGTGRERLARAIHGAVHGGGGSTSVEELLCGPVDALGARAPFVTADCATARAIESAIFGSCPADAHDTLETMGPDGLLGRAMGGTLFLRAVHDMPGRAQRRLARMLRDGEAWLDDGRASGPVTFDIRVMTSIDVGSPKEEGLLVPELEKRLAVHRIELPPLRHRREDLPAIVRTVAAEACAARRVRPKVLSGPAVSLLSALPWRGNFNELHALIDTFVVEVPGRVIRVADVLSHVRLDGGDVTFTTGRSLRDARERFEREYVAAVLQRHHGRVAEAAVALGIQRTNLYRKLRQLEVPRKPAIARTTRAPLDREEPETASSTEVQ